MVTTDLTRTFRFTQIPSNNYVNSQISFISYSNAVIVPPSSFPLNRFGYGSASWHGSDSSSRYSPVLQCLLLQAQKTQRERQTETCQQKRLQINQMCVKPFRALITKLWSVYSVMLNTQQIVCSSLKFPLGRPVEILIKDDNQTCWRQQQLSVESKSNKHRGLFQQKL